MAEKQSTRGKNLSESTQFMLSHHLWKKILIGLVLGILAGLTLSPSGFALLPQDLAFALSEWIRLPGVIFLGLIQMVIIPLVVCSIVLGIAESGNMENVKRLGLRVVPYFLMTTVIAVTIGVVLVQVMHPGSVIDTQLAQETISSGVAAGRVPGATFSDLTIPERIANLIPVNPAKAQLDRDMLQIVIASIIIGLALLGVSPAAGKPFRDLCISGQIIAMKIISWGMLLAPYAVFGLLCHITIHLGFDALFSLVLYMATVLGGLACMMAVYLLIVKTVARRNIRDFLQGIREVQLIAFSTSSSAATMPVSIQAAEEKLGIGPHISRFVIPLGATVNMDGTALYQAVAALFLCQVFGVDLSFMQIVMLVMTTVGASIGTPATPGVGIVVLATILVGIGVPPEGIALIIGVDRILDMCRTTVNVTGDLTASAVMQRWLPEA